jgi:uncharacterized protein
MFRRLLKTTEQNSFFLFGARGTGKTTYIKDLFHGNNQLYIDLLDPISEDAYARNPRLLEEEVLALPASTGWIIIDEVQKVPKLLDVVHKLIESTRFQFVLTGSSSRKLMHGGSNLLAGRAFVYTMHPLTYKETGPEFDLFQALQWGTLPKIYSFSAESDKQAYLRAYALTYIKEEIISEQILRKLDPFRNFLEIAAQTNGKIVNYTKIADDVGVDTKTVMSYFSILEDTLIGILLPPYHRSIRKQQRKNPKFYYFDTGVKRALDRTLSIPLHKGTYEFGNAFEHFIITEIIRIARYLYPDWRFYYLITGGGAEIDLIISRPGLPEVIIEIKSAETVQQSDVRNLNTFHGDFRSPLALCISRDQTRKKIGSVLCLHWKEGIEEIFPL